jgi:tetratricopeptide (TPR) repeat protein
MTATKASYGLISLAEAGPAAAERGFALNNTPGTRGGVALRRELGINSFGINAFYQGAAGEPVISEHDELGPGANRHEELYIVVSGSCTFTVDGETVDAPHGTALFVADPATKRGAVANEDDTTVVVVGGRPGEAFVISAGDALSDFFALYRDGEYARALEECQRVLETSHPGNPLVLYNIACMESLLGRTDDAVATLGEALSARPSFKELAGKDDDLAALRDDARFQQLVA